MAVRTWRWAAAFSLVSILLVPVPPGDAASRAVDIPALVDGYARKYGIPVTLARNLVRVESGFRQDAVSPSGARGVMQLLPATARALGVDIDDPEQNIEGGMRYLRMQYDRFGRWDLAVAAYHAGPAAVAKAGGIPPKSAEFVRRVVGSAPAAAPARSADLAHRLASGFAWPLQGLLTARFGRGHSGIDLAAPKGTPIRASRTGTVIHTGRYYEYGQTVILDHGHGVTTLYGHTSAILVGKGRKVSAGHVIARVGCTGRCTGPHVHFEIRVRGRAIDPLAGRTAGLPDAPPAAPTLGTQPDTATAGTAPAVLETRASGAGRVATAASGIVGDAIVTVRDVVRGGEVVERVETTTVTLEGGMYVRIVREYRLMNGELVLVSEQSTVYGAGEGREKD
ncbi:MAG TPA: peptidoglycan DD-metalloendopeptidase family protein [bacterium]|nr:peptidoglycan DD-metalloendopeptidase family protein [bacterium]